MPITHTCRELFGLGREGGISLLTRYRMFFPSVTETEGAAEETSEQQAEASNKADAQETAEARAIADELPSVPTGELSGTEHVDKKQKQDDA